MKLSAKAVKENWQKLQESLGYSFRNHALLAEAMTHRSYANESHSDVLPDNERLEFLGDAVLDLVISQYLMESLPDSHEGDLTRIRAEVVALPCLARLARSLDIGSALLLGRGEENSGGRDKPSLLADALEALFGAIFTDGGFGAAQASIMPLFVPLLQQASIDDGQDFKSRLQELMQSTQRELPVYTLIETTGPAHERLYRVDVMIDGCVYGSGRGSTKKSAEQAAAQATLLLLDEHL
ncbi:MAG: ribonuclease III [Desulfuromonadales bacterium]|nr:ribonuclease III [Desulfuromonadales bacterium]